MAVILTNEEHRPKRIREDPRKEVYRVAIIRRLREVGLLFERFSDPNVPIASEEWNITMSLYQEVHEYMSSFLRRYHVAGHEMTQEAERIGNLIRTILF